MPAYQQLLDLERQRLPLFIPVAMGFGAAAYYALLAEPHPGPWAAALLAVIAAGLFGRRFLWLRYSLLLLGAGLFGFVNASVHTQLAARKALDQPVFWKDIRGVVHSVQLDEGQQRVVLEVDAVESLPPELTPRRVRISFKKPQETAMQAGDQLQVKATLFPLPQPVAPGSFDFARYLYFQGLDAVGFTTAQAEITHAPPDIGDRINRFRVTFASHLLQSLPAPEGAVAAALTVGEQQAVPEEVGELLRDSGLYHILSISGLHMSLAAGLVFFAVRAFLALWPYLALHYSIKKMAAVVALASSFFYLLVAGAPVPAVRSFIMVAMVFTAILCDRKAISFYTLAWAAFFIILLQPHAVVSASFQLSFAATAAIVALYERYGSTLYQPGRGMLRRLATAMLATMLVSLVATLATSPLVITHFNRMQWWGMVANAVASPLTAFVIMPGAVLAFAGWPLGLEQLGFMLLSYGINGLLLVGQWVAAMPYASVYIPPFHTVGFVLAMLGLCLFLMLSTRLRLVGLVLLAAGAVSMAWYQPPHVFIGERAKQIAVSDASGQLVMLKGKADSFTGEHWARLHGSEVAVRRNEAVWSESITGGCEKEACWYHNGAQRFLFVVKPQAIRAMCDKYQPTALVINYRLYDGECASATTVVDRAMLTEAGSMDVRFEADQPPLWRMANPMRGQRPWTAQAAGG